MPLSTRPSNGSTFQSAARPDVLFRRCCRPSGRAGHRSGRPRRRPCGSRCRASPKGSPLRASDRRRLARRTDRALGLAERVRGTPSGPAARAADGGHAERAERHQEGVEVAHPVDQTVTAGVGDQRVEPRRHRPRRSSKVVCVQVVVGVGVGGRGRRPMLSCGRCRQPPGGWRPVPPTIQSLPSSPKSTSVWPDRDQMPVSTRDAVASSLFRSPLPATGGVAALEVGAGRSWSCWRCRCPYSVVRRRGSLLVVQVVRRRARR